MEQYYAHLENKYGQKEPLEVHLQKTSELSGRYAAAFGEASAGKWLGWFHDAGKASALFQGVLQGTEHRVNHAAAGAYLLMRCMPLARVIYAHHDGLQWFIRDDLERSAQEEISQDSFTGKRFAVSGDAAYQALFAYLKSLPALPDEKPVLQSDGTSFYTNLPEMLHLRMLLSCLCDADYTATASHEDASLFTEAEEKELDAAAVLQSIYTYKEQISKNSNADAKLNQIRNEVFRNCLQAAEQPSGLFTLTAPTGTGKTLSLLAFAVKHAEIYHKRRIIIVLPFLSIISQNAIIYADICGDILEAHSMAAYGCDEHTKLLAEQWNAPVIVTTSVKFFEAFFKSKPTDLRFLHSIANSVVVFDEAQSIPTDLIGTTIETMRMLCGIFRCTVLFSTATQPAFDVRSDIDFRAYEVLPDAAEIYAKTRRVSVNWDIDEKTPLSQIAAEMSERNSVCCVLNRKDHTRKLYDLLSSICDPEECFHISTDMCKAHRDSVIAEITRRLNHKLPCRLVSTSCIEAGVDLDFAYMYRALAPLDSIIQCAGRCNRNGRTAGEMTVLIPDEEKLYPAAFFENAANQVKLLRSRHEIDICNPEHIREYYTELLTDGNYNHDKKELVKAIADHDFTAAEKYYRFIPQTGVNVLVPYQAESELFEALAAEARTKGISGEWMRRAAPITVTSYREDKLKELAEPCFVLRKGKKEPISGWYILLDSKFYDARSGLHFDDESSLDYLI